MKYTNMGVSDYVENAGTGYTITVEITPDTESMQRAGYKTSTEIFTVYTGAEVYCDHDQHRLVRQLPGNARWLHNEFDRLVNELRRDAQ